MTPAYVPALRHGQPPHIDHGIVATALVLVLIHCPCNVAVAVVAAYVVHHAFVGAVSLEHGLIVAHRVIDIKWHILVGLAKC